MINLFIDSDGPVADFDHNLDLSGVGGDVFKHQPGTYLWLPVTPGAKKAMIALQLLETSGQVKIWIATKTPSRAPYTYTEKVLWYRRHFPWLEDRIILTHDKSLLGDKHDFLLDDRPHKANASMFKGTLFVFNVKKPEDSWDEFLLSVIERLRIRAVDD